MPNPWTPVEISRKQKDGTNGRSGSHILRDSALEPIALRIGKIISCWAIAEGHLPEIYSYLMDLPGWVAAEIFEEIRAPKVRVRFIQETMAKKITKEFSDSFCKEILNPIWKLYDDRNDLAHGRLVWSSEYPEGIILLKGWGDNRRRFLYEISTLDALLNELYERTHKLDLFMFATLPMITPLRYETGRVIPPFHPQSLDAYRRLKEESGGAQGPPQPSPAQNEPPESES